MPPLRTMNPLRLSRVSRVLAVLAAGAVLAAARPAVADDGEWPRQFDSSSGTFVIYQPQPEGLNGDVLTGRAAFSLQKSGDAYPVFGVLWFTEDIYVDRDSSAVTARNFDVTRVRLPGITPDLASRYEKLVEGQAAQWDLSGSLEELQAGLAAAEKERASVADLDDTPPRILFHERRAILVVYDGAPALEQIDGSKLQRVANTPYAVVYDPDGRNYYLAGANLWYRAKNPLGPWTDIPAPPRAVREAVPPDTSTYDRVAGPAPDVMTAMEPTELIATDGPPRWAPLVDDELLYVTNTESDVIREVGTQSIYVLIAGRWFRAPSTDGPWTYVRGDQLPDSFKRVPPDSPKGNILASVAGTDQAGDALADAEIPQTSAIRRDVTDFQVTYDGSPEFAPIEGTDLEYAVNTDAEVLLAPDGRYYACDQGIWYVSDDPQGPWSVSDTRPPGVEDIPPSCPVYDVAYVYVYDSTPDVVYVGYLPGYMGCYPHYGTVVYGTGYRYGSWRSRHHFYPRRFTWGFEARYNPWLSRWSFGSSYGSSFLRVGTRWQPGRPTLQRRVQPTWFGPGGFRRPLVAHDLTMVRVRPGRVRPRLPDALPMSVYSRPENVQRVNRTVLKSPFRSIARPMARPAAVPNDVFAGKDGKVYRRDATGTWQVRQGTNWKPTTLPTPPPAVQTPVTRERTGGPSVQPSQPGPGTQPPPRYQPKAQPQPDQRSQADQRSQPRGANVERRVPPRYNPPSQPSQPQPRPNPPSIGRTPGDLEREYRARERSSPGGGGTPPPSARPTQPREEPRNQKTQEPPREKQQERGKSNRR